MSLAIPVFTSMLPIRINNGIARRIWDAVAPNREEATMYKCDGPHKKEPNIRLTIIMAKETGQPMVRRKKREPKRSVVINPMLISHQVSLFH